MTRSNSSGSRIDWESSIQLAVDGSTELLDRLYNSALAQGVSATSGGSLNIAIEAIRGLPEISTVVRNSVHDLDDSQPLLLSITSQVDHLTTIILDTEIEIGGVFEQDIDKILEQVIKILLYLRTRYIEGRNNGVNQNNLNAIEDMLARYQRIRRDLDYDETRQRSQTAAAQIEELRDETIAIAESTKEAAGTAADSIIAKHYEDFAASENRQASIFRSLAIGFDIVAFAVAIWIVQKVLDKTGSAWTAELLKLLAVVPILALAFYFAHESSGHRAVSRRAKEYQVRLQTLDAFIAPLSKVQADELRGKVGDSILTGPISLSQDSDNKPFDIKDVIEVAKELRAQAEG